MLKIVKFSQMSPWCFFFSFLLWSELSLLVTQWDFKKALCVELSLQVFQLSKHCHHLISFANNFIISLFLLTICPGFDINLMLNSPR